MRRSIVFTFAVVGGTAVTVKVMVLLIVKSVFMWKVLKWGSPEV
jgi:hypothetical protein